MADEDDDFWFPAYEEAIDYDEEGRKILAALNLDPDRKKGYHDLDPIWSHPETKATIYVGNISAASKLPILVAHDITHVVNCTDSLPNYHEPDPNTPSAPKTSQIVYHTFDINRWCFYRKSILEFVEETLRFIENALENGRSVLVHCLAGAHRAGTTGVLCLMYFAKKDRETATKYAQLVRPEIDPFGYLVGILKEYEKHMPKDQKD